jgi:cytochrome c
MCGAGSPSFFLVAAIVLLAAPLAIRAGDSELGAYLASECTSCHQPDGRDQGIPSIIGWKEGDFVAAMRAFQSGKAQNPVMRSVATSLSDDEIAALASFFAALRHGEKLQ